MELKYNSDELDAIKDVIDNNDITILESLGCKIPRYGDIRCPCPVHNGDHQHGFSYSFRLKTWKCWTNHCHEKYGSTLIGLIMGIKQCSFPQAVKLAIDICKIDINSMDANECRIKAFINRNSKYEEALPKIFDRNILMGLDHKVEYFLNQGFQANTLFKFEAFYSGKRTHPLYNRACLPIKDDDGNILGFTGRALNNEIIPKWMHYPRNISTSKLLFRLDLAKDCIKDTGCAILVEGPKDVMKLCEAGLNNVVSPFGTNIHINQIKLLHKYGCKTLLLALDPDEGGLKAKEQIMNKCRLHFNIIDIGYLFENDPGDTDLSKLTEIISPDISEIINKESIKYV